MLSISYIVGGVMILRFDCTLPSRANWVMVIGLVMSAVYHGREAIPAAPFFFKVSIAPKVTRARMGKRRMAVALSLQDYTPSERYLMPPGAASPINAGDGLRRGNALLVRAAMPEPGADRSR
jgi:hypothetical protein